MIARIKSYLGIEPLTLQQVVIGGGAGALAQLALIWDATTAAVIQLPFFVLTLVCMLNWFTGGLNAMIDRRFTVRGFYKGPLRWMSYIILAVLVANMSLLLQQAGIETDVAVGVITGIYVIAAIREADSVVENIDLPPYIRETWARFTSKHRGDGS